MTVTSSGIHPAYAYAKLPRAGLGNKLLVWANARVFAHINSMPLLVSGWVQPQLGPMLRGESRMRWYASSFTSSREAPVWAEVLARGAYRRRRNPAAELLAGVDGRTLYVFDSVPHWADYFAGVRDHRDYVRRSLDAMIAPAVRARIAGQSAPCIAVHVRHGDFRQLAQGEDFATVGTVRTPLDYFIALVNGIRKIAGQELPVTVFSDGSNEDLAPLLAVPNTRRASPNPDVVDMLLMARGRVIICSAGSTFSYWAGFLADAPVLLHPDHIHAAIRPREVNAHWFEGGVRGAPEEWPELLRSNLRELVP